MKRPSDADLEGMLRDLGENLETGQLPETLADTVLARIGDEPIPTRSSIATAVPVGWLRARWRWVVGLALGAVLSGIAVSPVGAEISEWFGFRGVQVRLGDDAPTRSPSVPPAAGRLTLAAASELIDFTPLVPRELGPPDDVEVSSDRRVLSMSWTLDGTVRLDQFDAKLSPVFAKSASRATWVRVGTGDGLWFPVAHEVALLDEAGVETTAAPRLAAKTLIWASNGRTFRLEGDLSRREAIALAESLR